MANQDGPFEYIEDEPDADEAVDEVVHNVIRQIQDGGVTPDDLPAAVFDELKRMGIDLDAMRAAAKARTDEIPDDAYITLVLDTLNHHARNFVPLAHGVAGDERFLTLLQTSPNARAAIVKIAELTEQAGLLLQEAVISATPLSDERMDEEVLPEVAALSQHIRDFDDE